MKYLKNFIIIIAILSGFSCTEEINWETEEMPEMLVVEGSFTNELKKHTILLTKSADYFYNKATPKVSGATVTISDGTKVFGFIENPEGSGIYETIDSVAGEAGKTYVMDIDLAEPINNTTHYFASAEMVKGLEIDSMEAMLFENPFYIEGFEMDSLILVLVTYGQEPGEFHNYYQVNLYKNDTLINDTIDKVSVADDSQGLNGIDVYSYLFLQQFNEYDRIELEVLSVEKSFMEFLTGIQNIVNQSPDPFNMSGPPANAIGNIQGAQAIGYFKVAYVSRGSALARLQGED